MRIFRDYHDYLISLQNNYDNKTNELLSAIYRRTPIEDALKNWKDALKNRNNEYISALPQRLSCLEEAGRLIKEMKEDHPQVKCLRFTEHIKKELHKNISGKW